MKISPFPFVEIDMDKAPRRCTKNDSPLEVSKPNVALYAGYGECVRVASEYGPKAGPKLRI